MDWTAFSFSDLRSFNPSIFIKNNVRTNRQSNLRCSCQSIFSLSLHHPNSSHRYLAFIFRTVAIVMALCSGAPRFLPVLELAVLCCSLLVLASSQQHQQQQQQQRGEGLTSADFYTMVEDLVAGRDYYELLEVSPEQASQPRELKKAFRALTLRWCARCCGA